MINKIIIFFVKNTVKNRVQYDLVREKVSEELSKLYQ